MSIDLTGGGLPTFVAGTTPKDDNWRCFLMPGDHWLIGYFCLPLGLTSVQPFMVAHAVELYLKAAYARHTGSVQKAMGKGHNVKGIWDELRQDPAFMPAYGLVESIYNQSAAMAIGGALAAGTSPEDSRKYFAHQELYLVMHLLADLKYIGTPIKAAKGGPISIGYIFPNEYWVGFFRELRNYLRYPATGELDHLAEALKGEDVPPRARFYLEKLYG
jgi:hypothetical protein